MASNSDGVKVPVRYHKPFRFMLLEKQQRENNFKESNEPDFRPRYRRTLPAGMDIRQGTSLGVGNLTQLPVYRDTNEIQSKESYRDRAPDVVQMKKSRYCSHPESWQSVTSSWNSTGVRPTTGTYTLYNYKRKAAERSRYMNSENQSLRYHSANFERAIPGYAGHRNTQPKFHNRTTRADNRYGNIYNDNSPIHSASSYKRTGTFSRMVTLLPPHNPFANSSK